MKSGIAAFDIHYPYHNKAAIKILLKTIEITHPAYFIFGGDNMDFDCISHHNKDKYRLLEGKRLAKDYKGFQKNILDEIEKRLPENCKRYFMLGNHEVWIEKLLEQNPTLVGLVEIEKNLDLHKYQIIPYNKTLSIGHLNFIHGYYTNKYHAEKNARIYQQTLIYGHLHTNQVWTNVTPINQKPKQSIAVGSLCNLNPNYLHNRPNSWLNQFFIWYMLPDNTFYYQTPIILNGKTVINGELINGN